MQDTLTPLRPRVVFHLKRTGRQLFVITEENVIFISETCRRRAEIDELADKLEDPDTHPALVLGPNATVIPISQVVGTKLHAARGYLDIETTDEIHRVAGWTNGPTVVYDGEVRRPSRLTVTSNGAVEGANRRVQLRLNGLPGDDAISRVPETLEPEFANQVLQQDTDVSFTPLKAWTNFLSTLALFVGFTLAAILIPEVQRWMFAFFALTTLWSLAFSIPGPLQIGPYGIVWGRWIGKRLLQWQEIERLEFVEGDPSKHRLFVVTKPDGFSVPFPFTDKMSSQHLDELRLAISKYRTCVDGLDQPSGQLGPQPKSDKSARRKKPVVQTEISRHPRWQRWSIAILLAIVVPFLLAIVALVASY